MWFLVMGKRELSHQSILTDGDFEYNLKQKQTCLGSANKLAQQLINEGNSDVSCSIINNGDKQTK